MKGAVFVSDAAMDIWRIGCICPMDPKEAEEEPGILVALPFTTKPMTNGVETFYCCCIQCRECIANVGSVCLKFTNSLKGWGVRICCAACDARPFNLLQEINPIINIEVVIAQLMFDQRRNLRSVCDVCLKSGCCEDPECSKARAVLYPTEVEGLLGYFYCVKLDVCLPLIRELRNCTICGKRASRKCDVCRAMCFCSARCKAKHKAVCVPYECVWNSFPQGKELQTTLM